MPIDQFTTARLSVHNWRSTIDDNQARKTLEASLSAILSDSVLEHLPEPLQLHRQDGGVSSWIDERAEESEVLLVNWKHDRELIGLMILASSVGTAERPTIHVGYLLAETAWGQGIASELLNGFVLAARSVGPTQLLGGVGKDNPASARVLQKAGFEFAPDISTEDTDTYVQDID